MKKIIILNFSTSEVFVFDYDTNIFEDAEVFFEALKYENEDYDFSDSNCQWMITPENEIDIKFR